jgi:uncharacterized protein (TIGR02246 family)
MSLEQFNADYIAAYNAGDAPLLTALFTDDAVVMNSFGTIVSGRPAILAALQRSFAGPCQGATLQINPQHSRRLSDAIALQQGTTRTTRNTEPPTSRDFTYTKVLVRQGDAWKLAAAQFSILAPPPPEFS